MLFKRKFSYFFFPTCFALVKRGVGERGLLWAVDLYDGPYVREVIYLTRTHCFYLIGRVEVTRALWLLSVAFIILVRYFLRKSYFLPNIGITVSVEFKDSFNIIWDYNIKEQCVECNLILPYERILYYGSAGGHRKLLRFFYYMLFKVFMRCIFRRINFYDVIVLRKKKSIYHIIKKYVRLKLYHSKNKKKLW